MIWSVQFSWWVRGAIDMKLKIIAKAAKVTKTLPQSVSFFTSLTMIDNGHNCSQNHQFIHWWTFAMNQVIGRFASHPFVYSPVYHGTELKGITPKHIYWHIERELVSHNHIHGWKWRMDHIAITKLTPFNLAIWCGIASSGGLKYTFEHPAVTITLQNSEEQANAPSLSTLM